MMKIILLPLPVSPSTSKSLQDSRGILRYIMDQATYWLSHTSEKYVCYSDHSRQFLLDCDQQRIPFAEMLHVNSRCSSFSTVLRHLIGYLSVVQSIPVQLANVTPSIEETWGDIHIEIVVVLLGAHLMVWHRVPLISSSKTPRALRSLVEYLTLQAVAQDSAVMWLQSLSFLGLCVAWYASTQNGGAGTEPRCTALLDLLRLHLPAPPMCLT